MTHNNTRLCRVLGLLGLLWLAACPHAFAQTKRLVEVPISDTPSYAKRALVIGVTDYALAPQLHVCAYDAKEFATLLKTRFGFSDVTLMTDDPTTPLALRPTCANLRRAVHGLLKGIVPGKSEVVLFYSGHGVRLGSDSDWLVPEDGDPQDISRTCVNYTQIVEALNTERPKRAFLVTDACRSLLSGKGVGGSGFGKGLEGIPLAPEVAEMLSCQPTEVSQEGLATDFPESVFTHFLVKGLEGDPDAVAEGTKNVTFDSLLQYVQGRVSQYVSSRFNVSQVPDGRTTLGRMVLARAGGAVPEAVVPPPVVSPPAPSGQNLLPPVTRIRAAIGDEVYAIQFQDQWLFCLFGTAQATMAADVDAMKFTVTQTDGTDWHCQIKYGMNLVNGDTYELRYRAKADTDRTLSVTGEYNSIPNPTASGFHLIGLTWDQGVQLTPEWQTFSQHFVVNGAADGHNIMPEFLFGNQTGSVWIADVSLVHLAAPSPAPAIGELPPAFKPMTKINPKDGAEMVYVPAGPFLMGDDGQWENPRHTVTLSGYWIYKNDVTVAMYRKFCDATGHAMPTAPVWGWQDDHPIVNVTWDEAKAYCDWAGVHLPTEAQWEKAARGTDGRLYPWGNDWNPSQLAQSAEGTTQAGTFAAGASPYGCLDMAVNVWNWCADWSDADYWRSDHGPDPTGPVAGPPRVTSWPTPVDAPVRVKRGGSWQDLYPTVTPVPDGPRASSRGYHVPDGRYRDGGFRGASGP